MSRNIFKCFKSKSNVRCEPKKYSNKSKNLDQNKSYKLSEKELNLKQKSIKYPTRSYSTDNVNMNTKNSQQKYSNGNSERRNEGTNGKLNIGFRNDEFSSKTDLKSLKNSKANSQVNLSFSTDYDEDMLNEILVNQFNLACYKQLVTILLSILALNRNGTVSHRIRQILVIIIP
jgi:hypothetical protein